MHKLDFAIDAISAPNLQIILAVLAKNDQLKKLSEDGLGPLALAGALSDFYQILATLESGQNQLDAQQLSEFGDYGLDLLDALAAQLRQLDIMDQRTALARVYASLALWLARRNAQLGNLTGIADSFAGIVNALSATDELAAMCRIMHEIIDAVAPPLVQDADRSNPSRPWRVLNLNTGIAATRSLDPQLMAQSFDKLAHYLPLDLPGFLVDGKRQMAGQNVPKAVLEMMDRYRAAWPATAPH